MNTRGDLEWFVLSRGFGFKLHSRSVGDFEMAFNLSECSLQHVGFQGRRVITDHGFRDWHTATFHPVCPCNVTDTYHMSGMGNLS
jgi:hypothetical protein